jgi:hypothetical protein
LTAEYLLILFLSSQEPAGRAFFEISRITPPLRRELSF